MRESVSSHAIYGSPSASPPEARAPSRLRRSSQQRSPHETDSASPPASVEAAGREAAPQTDEALRSIATIRGAVRIARRDAATTRVAVERAVGGSSYGPAAAATAGGVGWEAPDWSVAEWLASSSQIDHERASPHMHQSREGPPQRWSTSVVGDAPAGGLDVWGTVERALTRPLRDYVYVYAPREHSADQPHESAGSRHSTAEEGPPPPPVAGPLARAFVRQLAREPDGEHALVRLMSDARVLETMAAQICAAARQTL